MIVVRIPAWQWYFIFCFCCFLFAFVVFILIFFSFLSFTASTIRQLLHLGIKSQKAGDILYCVHKFSSFLCSHSPCLHNRAILTPRIKFYSAKHVYRVYITFLIICFQIASNCYIYHKNKLLKCEKLFRHVPYACLAIVQFELIHMFLGKYVT